VDEGDAGVVDAPLAVAGAARGGVGGGRVGGAEADGDGDLLHGCGGGEDNGRRAWLGVGISNFGVSGGRSGGTGKRVGACVVTPVRWAGLY